MKALIILTIFLGIGFRFFNLGYKVYWYDEVQTSLRISGHTKTELIQQIYNTPPMSVEKLLETYQYPNSERDFADVLHALKQHPEHSPLYYLTARFWLQSLSHSTAILRSLSALISLLIFPAMYWLCWELFQSEALSWIAMGLVAISPFHVLYAQEAREYSLWTVVTLVTSAALLKAFRSTKDLRSWGLYGFTVALNLYSHPLGMLTLLGQGIYTLCIPNQQKKKQVANFIGAFFLGLLLFLPWLIVGVIHFENFLENTESKSVSRPDLQLLWGLNLGRIFFDVNQGTSLWNPTLYLILALVIYALYILICRSPIRVWLFVLTLIGTTGLGLMLPDLIWGGQRSAIARYAIPCYLGIQIAVAHLLTIKLASSKPKRWQWITLILLLTGILSCAINSQHQVWWNKSPNKSRYNPALARIVNQSDTDSNHRPLIISDEEPGRIISFSHLLNPEVQVQFVLEPNIPQLPPVNSSSRIFLYRPSETLREGLKQIKGVSLQKAFKKGWLWQIILEAQAENSSN
ncbi:MAG: hypothetical protein ACFBSC_07880 [Microcoleaceae cyanobacterium]